MKFKRILLTIITLISCAGLSAQEQPKYVTAYLIDGDTVPVVYLNQYIIAGERTFATKSEKKKYNRLKYNVTKVYPYAKMASDLLKKYEYELAHVESEREKRHYYKKVEQELRAKYEHELMNLTITQGRLLIKLIDRETGSTSYELVKNLRGDFTAFLFQGLAKLFGQDLKDDYDPATEDKMIEDIVTLIEAGQIRLAAK